ncbi:cytochrome P450 71A9-like [Salvia hispanica]|uniref:cytochrome P450 71A9-like n=1 Tax=Salvia hispanica TaxID=49212 RepID=UPI002009C29E|nr:cytochrome P450 71A9-like [Salvia hispanica]
MILFISLLTFITLFFLVLNKAIRKPGKLPPGPQKLPIIGNLHQLGKLPHRSLQKLSQIHGDLMFLHLGFTPALVVSSAEKARDIFKNHDLAFSGRPALYSFDKVCYNHSCVSTAPYGAYWREARRIEVLELMTGKRVQSFRHIRAEEVGRMIDSILGTAPDPVDLSSAVFAMSNNVISRAAFGAGNGNGNGKSFREIISETQSLAVGFNLADYFPGLGWVNRVNGVDKRIAENRRDLERVFERVIGEHRDRTAEDSGEGDIIGVLLRVQKESDLTDDQLKAILMEVFVAGTDSVAATIIWTMTELIRNPTVRRKAQQQVREIAKGKPMVDESDLPKLSYLKQVIKESFRLHPPAPLLVPRETIEPCAIDGGKYHIPAKTRVFFNLTAMSVDPVIWKNPREFSPERFEDSEVDFRGKHFELLPFGAGRRGCPGINFSIPVVELAVANLLFRFDWKLPEGISAEDIDMDESLGIVMRKKTPLCLIASSANN